MQSGETSAGDLTRREKILLAEYAEVCTSHAGITDFRAKLLALLPIASGAGIALLQNFHWIVYLFGAVLVVSGIKMALGKGKEIHPEKNPLLCLFRRIIPVTA